MNSGFGSTTFLKTLVLPPQLRGRADWDEALALMGRGVVAAFQAITNRVFARLASAAYIRDAAVRTISVPRYPIETVASISLKLATEAAFTVQTEVVANTDLESGLIHLTQILGGHRDQVKAIYTGGWWWNTAEDESDAQPSGSNLVPDDVISAWAMQVQHQIEVTGLMKAQSAQAKPETAEIKLLPAVMDILKPHIRMA